MILESSPALKIINLLQDNFSNVQYYDPYIKKITLDNNKILKSTKTITNFKTFDLV